jgi:hypothetical protein
VTPASAVLSLISLVRSRAPRGNARDSFESEPAIKAFLKIVNDPRQGVLMQKLAPLAASTATRYLTKIGSRGMGGRAGFARLTAARRAAYTPMSGLFGSDSDHDVGLAVVTAYANQAMKYPQNFPYTSVDDFVAYATSKVSDYLETVGSLVKANSASISQSDAENSVIAAADSSQGTATLPQIVMAAGGHGASINYFQAVPEVATNIASDVATTAAVITQSVGAGALGTLKLARFLPLLLVGAGAAFILLKSGGLEGLASGKRRSE